MTAPVPVPLFEHDGEMRGGALVSSCRTWRYELWRTWGSGPRAMFVGLNPSTADETEDDPTIRRCIRFARDWGFDGLVMANLFAFRSTDPERLQEVPDPVGPINDDVLADLASKAGVVVAAWGVHGVLYGRDEQVIDSGVLRDYAVLGLTANGHPRHPLYMRADCRPLNHRTMDVVA